MDDIDLNMAEYDSIIDRLTVKYFEILQKHHDNLRYLYEDKCLSGIFLPTPTLDYVSCKYKVMIVGQEPRKWKKRQLINLESVQTSMARSQEILTQKKTGHSKFLQFYKRASRNICQEHHAIAWGNQFCMSYKKRSITKLIKKDESRFNDIKQLSFDIFQAQIEILKPELMIFTTGSGRDKYIKELFTQYKTECILVPRRLWHFKIVDIHCIRTNHPCAYGVPNLNKYLKNALKHATCILHDNVSSRDRPKGSSA